MKPVVIWGATGHAKVLVEALSENDAYLVALVDNTVQESPIQGIPLLKGQAELEAWLAVQTSELFCCVAVGGSHGADRIMLRRTMLALGLTPLTIVHRTAFVAKDATLGNGCQVLAHASVCSHATISASAIINTAASIDHDTFIGEGAHIAPGATLTGEVTVEARAFVGAGAVVLPRLTIGEDSIVGAGAVVTKSVFANTTVVGSPARPIPVATTKQ